MINLIIQNCNQCKVEGPLKVTLKLFNTFRIKHPEAFHIRMYNKKWDGYVNYINNNGFFKIGLLPKVYNTLKSWGEEVKITDLREKIPDPVIPKTIGGKELYPKQINALETLLNNKVGDTKFLICAGDYSVGFGKTLIFCAIHESFKRKIPTILLLNDSDLFNQFKREIPPLLPNEDIKFIRGGKVEKWGNFNVAMVQSIAQNIRKYQNNLSKIGIVLIDEADIIDNKTYKTVIEHLYNTSIRIGLSGTLYMSQLKKKVIHNMNIMQFIGDKVDQVKLSDQIKSGKATPVIVKMVYIDCDHNYNNYGDAYEKVICNNPNTFEVSFNRVLFNAKYGRFPMLIVTKYINHCENLYKYFLDKIKQLNLSYSVNYVHHKTKYRDKILEDFRNGKIDILISTTIISRGKNFPELKYLQNASSIDSNEKSIQILGRLVRQHSSKQKAYLDDLFYYGKYFKRHGNHRKNYYIKEKLKVIKINKDVIKR